ncbi:MAG TPA: NADH-quinone oxidoreductase subunit NuoF [Acholeplasmataceae bacterium]|nr:NADH-quinone oxidoreductase subunit NuoF [Acholeplasmataceae bacterium]HRX44621.1 NADH-quinone oxidoreductase subunit NuoF [Acholeplasmataceae bacterium]
MLERTQVLICGGTGCMSSKSKEIKDTFENVLLNMNMKDEVGLVLTGCFGLCEKGPVVVVYPDETFYSHVTLDDVEVICQEHLLKGRPVQRLLVKDPIDKKLIKNMSQLKFYSKQRRIALRNCGNINPLEITEYIAKDGYMALGKVLTQMTPQEAIDEMIKSGLRGRGGGGFSTGKKWQFARNSVSDQKYVICNADEGDPGAFMDRAVLEGDPHSVLEAMAICGYAIGANQGYIYVRAEYPVAVERLNIAIKQARDMNLLGNNLFGTDFSFDIDIRLGAGAFVCGEETALIASIEGYRGMPRLKPPFPAVKGLWGQPTNVNNVETFANVPVVYLKGADWFKSIGTEKSSGTKVFALGGKIVNTGLVEVPMGTTLREVIYDIGGGIPNKRKFKAVQTGGPSGGCITEKDLDTPIEFETLTSLGSMMGSGGMIVMDEDNCMVDVARFYLDFTVDESCGKCTPCREGTKQMKEILDRICEGNGTMKDIDELDQLAHMIKETSLCGLGQTAPNPVLSTLKHFRHEYEAHVKDKTCPAGVCRDLTNFVIDDSCIGCTKCAKNCPTNAITGWPKQKHNIDLDLCIRCGACKKACPVGAISSVAIHEENRI